MEKIKIKIGDLANIIEEYNNSPLTNNQEVNVQGMMVNTPSGLSPINQFIKKENLDMVEILFSNNTTLLCSNKHILVKNNGNFTLAKDLKAGDLIITKNGPLGIKNINSKPKENCFDIAIPYPHVYYDAAGLLHHNTITTATMALCAELHGRTLTIVPNKSLVKQTYEDFKLIGLDVGVYYGDKKEVDKTHIIATWQSLESARKKLKNGESSDLSKIMIGLVAVMVDEAHSGKADVLRDLLTNVFNHIPIRWGLTGTIPKEEYDELSLVASLGPIIHKVEITQLQEAGILANCHVNILQTEDDVLVNDYQAELDWLLSDKERLNWMAKFVSQLRGTGNTLVLVSRKKTGKHLEANIKDAIFISGDDKVDARKEHYDSVNESHDKVIIATYGVAAVGINIPRIFNLVLVEGGRGFIRTIQSIGRSIRVAKDKDFAQVWDICSTAKYSKRHLGARKTWYKEKSFPFEITKVNYDDWNKNLNK